MNATAIINAIFKQKGPYNGPYRIIDTKFIHMRNVDINYFFAFFLNLNILLHFNQLRPCLLFIICYLLFILESIVLIQIHRQATRWETL